MRLSKRSVVAIVLAGIVLFVGILVLSVRPRNQGVPGRSAGRTPVEVSEYQPREPDTKSVEEHRLVLESLQSRKILLKKSYASKATNWSDTNGKLPLVQLAGKYQMAILSDIFWCAMPEKGNILVNPNELPTRARTAKVVSRKWVGLEVNILLHWLCANGAVLGYFEYQVEGHNANVGIQIESIISYPSQIDRFAAFEGTIHLRIVEQKSRLSVNSDQTLPIRFKVVGDGSYSFD